MGIVGGTGQASLCDKDGNKVSGQEMGEQGTAGSRKRAGEGITPSYRGSAKTFRAPNDLATPLSNQHAFKN